MYRPPSLRLLYVLSLAVSQLLYHVSGDDDCRDDDELTFIKVPGFAPETKDQPPLLYSSTYGAAITAECYNRCRASNDCRGFILDYAKSSCHRIPNLPLVDNRLEHNSSVAYFQKLCLRLPVDCDKKAWSLEVIPNYELTGFTYSTIKNVTSRWECGERCLGAAEGCSSANYFPRSQSCQLSRESRWPKPHSFIPTIRSESFYIENHCNDDEKNKCWHDPIYNQTSIRSDLQSANITQEECRAKCREDKFFRCRGYSYLAGRDERRSECLLHSDPAGPSSPQLGTSLVPTREALYVQAIHCLNLTVSCDTKWLTLTLKSDNYKGLMYIQGYSDSCYTQGKGENVTALRIPLSSHQCGLRTAHALSPTANRTMISGVLVVQENVLIQTATDSVVRVSCVLPVQDRLNLNTGFSVLEPGAQTEIAGTGQIGGIGGEGEPVARISVVDPRTNAEPEDILLGDPLILKIHVKPPYNVSMVRASRLIATSGSQRESQILLDSRGCPPDVTVFPPLRPSGSQDLQAEFRAFRFPSSPLLTLSLILTLCPVQCEPIDCGNGGTSSRKKRKRMIATGYQEIPLQLVLMIHTDQNEPNSSSLLQASLGGDIGRDMEDPGQICTSFLTASLIGLFWVLIQCCLLAGCCFFIHRNQKDYADTISLRNDFQPRHVSWSDETNSAPTKGLRLTTPMRT